MDLAQRRLDNQYVNGSRSKDPAVVVRALFAVQAQDYHASLWAIGLRLRGASEADVERSIRERRIVRTWPMRGTLHFVAAQDVHWLVNLLGPRVLSRNAARLYREFAIDSALVKRATKIVQAALGGGQAVTRSSLYVHLEKRGIQTSKQRGLHILWWLAHEGLICCGPREGKQPTFVLLEDWIPAQQTPPRDKAMAMLAHRYFTHHGPATLADFVWWSGLTIADGKEAIAAAQSQLTSETIDKAVWWSGHERQVLSRHHCHLLPVYDEYLIGYADRSHALNPSRPKPAAGHGIFRSPIIINGHVVGSWARKLKRDRVSVELSALQGLPREDLESIGEAATRYGNFLGLPVALSKG